MSYQPQVSPANGQIPVSSVAFAAYQRKPDMKRVQRIADKFSIDRMRPIEVSYRDGKYWCFDGQHRTAVYSLLGKKTIPAIIHYGLNYEAEAALFASQFDEVAPVSMVTMWKAQVAANDLVVTAINDMCHKYGFSVAEQNAKPKYTNIFCIATLKKAYSTIGPLGLECILSLINDAWYGQEESTRVDVIEGLALIREAYDNDPSKPSQIDYKRLRKVMKNTSPHTVIRDAGIWRVGRYAHGQGRGVPFARHLVSLYNKNLSAKSAIENVFYI